MVFQTSSFQCHFQAWWTGGGLMSGQIVALPRCWRIALMLDKRKTVFGGVFVECVCHWSFPLTFPSWAPTEQQHTMDCCFGQDDNHKFMDLFCECLHLFGQKTVTLQWKWAFPGTTSISCSTPFHCLLVLKPVETHSSDCDGKPWMWIQISFPISTFSLLSFCNCFFWLFNSSNSSQNHFQPTINTSFALCSDWFLLSVFSIHCVLLFTCPTIFCVVLLLHCHSSALSHVSLWAMLINSSTCSRMQQGAQWVKTLSCLMTLTFLMPAFPFH